MLKEKIIADRNESAKTNLVKKTLLNTVLGECDRVTKEPTDEQVVKIIKKMIEGNLLVGTQDKLDENKILEEYLPKMMDDTELEKVISVFIFQLSLDKSNKANIGQVMKFLQANYFGQYDGKKASEIVKNIFNQ